MRRATVIVLSAANTSLAAIAIVIASISKLALPEVSGEGGLDRPAVPVLGADTRAFDITAALERPLFLRGRLPAPSDVPSPEKDNAENAPPTESADDESENDLQSDYVLTGVVMREGEAFVLVEPLGEEKPAALARGQVLGEWRLDEIHTDRAVFSRKALSQVLVFPEPSSSSEANAGTQQGKPRARTYRSP